MANGGTIIATSWARAPSRSSSESDPDQRQVRPSIKESRVHASGPGPGFRGSGAGSARPGSDHPRRCAGGAVLRTQWGASVSGDV